MPRSSSSSSPLLLQPVLQFISLPALLLLLTLTSSIFIPTDAQFTTNPTPGCPVGVDCVGLQLSPYLTTQIDCMSNPAFTGFTCEMGSGEGSFLECPKGNYCPTPTEVIECPAGYWCHRASAYPQECLGGASCPKGTYKQAFVTLFIFTLIVIIALRITITLMHRRFRNQAEERLKLYKANASLGQERPAWEHHRMTRGRETRGSLDVNTQPKLRLEFEKVSVAVKDSNSGQKPTNPTQAAASVDGMKTILQNISGSIRGGRLTAVMGPSGSGKTTFLNALLNKIPISSGSILINQHHTVQEVIRMNIVGYVPQADTMMGVMTVRDLIEHSARMRLPDSMTWAAKSERVTYIMELLGIKHIADTVVGDDLKRGISGGEKKRVSIAMELVADPQILFLDEPTSGLDSAAAMQVCDSLLAVTRQFRVVCCVIHQPRWEIFSRFQDVLLLGKGGIVIYFGPVSNIRDFFASMGFVPPLNTNPADFYLDVISKATFLHDFVHLGLLAIQQRAKSTGRVVHIEPTPHEDDAWQAQFMAGDEPNEADVLSQTMSSSNLLSTNGTGDEEKQLDAGMDSAGSPMASPRAAPSIPARPAVGSRSAAAQQYHASLKPIIPNKPASWFTQFRALFYRAFMNDYREPTFIFLDSTLQILPGVGLGVNALGIDTYYPALPNIVADTCIQIIGERCRNHLTLDMWTIPPFFFTMIMGVGAMMWSVNTFGRSHAVFFRDRMTGQSTLALFLAKATYDLIHLFRMVFIFISLFFLMTGPRGGFGGWFVTILMLFYAAMGVAYFISIVVPQIGKASTICVVCAVCFSVTAGLSPSMNLVKGWNILNVFWIFSYNRWAAEAFSILDMNGAGDRDRNMEIVDSAGYDGKNFNTDVGMIFFIGCLWRAAAYLAILKSKPRTEF